MYWRRPMDDTKLKKQIGINISTFRKRIGLTQMALAERLSYSDKAVSKWERGESAPDVLTLIELSKQFGVTVNDLLADPNELPADIGKVEQAMGRAVEKHLKRKANKNVILMLSSILVWFVALFVFVVLSSFDIPKTWIAFFYAIPANAIVALSLRSAWHDFRWNQGLITAIVWGSLLSIHATLLVFWNINMWKLYLLGIPGQLAIFLWFRLFTPKKDEENG